MYHFVSCFINVTDLSVDIAWQECTTLLVSQLPVCISSYFCLYFDNWLLIRIPKKCMIIISEFPNGKTVNRKMD